LKDPLVHLIRNAVDHGLEKPDVREAQGKNPCGLIRLTAAHSGGNILVTLQDDGAGFDRARILEKAKRIGLVSAKDAIRDKDIYNLVFQSGFTTAETVTDLSGRGVGLDVVRRNIDNLRGTVEITSTAGQGSTITIRLPLTLAIIEGFSVRVGNEVFVVPLEHVTECTELPASQRNGEASGILNLRGDPVPYVRLRHAFGVSGQIPKKENIVIVKVNESHAGIAVDELLGGMQTVVKPLGKAFRAVHGVAGSTVLGDGRVGLIIDVPSLLRDVMQSSLQAQA
jgi:two-component system, chemotaxis family, sensor kinase CheA